VILNWFHQSIQGGYNGYFKNGFSAREHERETAKKIMIAGGIVLFAGFAISASLKKKDLSA